MSLATQLKAGIRVLDIRSRHIQDRFAIHHGPVFQNAMFGNDVLKPVVDFLRAHPGEIVLMRVKEEHDPADNTRTFAETFEWYRDEVWYHDDEGTPIAPYRDWIWMGTQQNPKLGQVRGKIVILDNFAGGTYGIAWGEAEIQDEYGVATNWDLDDKWYKIRDHADRGLYLATVGLLSLPAARLAHERAAQETDQTLAVKPCDLLHLVQQVLSLPTAGFHIAGLHLAQVPVAFVNGHSILSGHFPSVTFSLEGMIPLR